MTFMQQDTTSSIKGRDRQHTTAGCYQQTRCQRFLSILQEGGMQALHIIAGTCSPSKARLTGPEQAQVVDLASPHVVSHLVLHLQDLSSRNMLPES